MRSGKPVTVVLGRQQKSLDVRVASGAYASASEVIQAALRALDREEEAVKEIMRAKLREAEEDPRPDIPADEVFKNLRAHHAERVTGTKRDA